MDFTVPPQPEQKLDTENFLTKEELIKQLEISGVNLGDDPSSRIDTFVNAGLLPIPQVGHFPTWTVQRIIAIENKLAAGQSLPDIQKEVKEERRRFLSGVTDLNSLVSLYKKFQKNSAFFLFSFLLLFTLSMGVFASSIVFPGNPVAVAGKYTVKAVADGAGKVAKVAAAPVGKTLVVFIQASKPQDSKSADPLNLTNIEAAKPVASADLVQLDESGNIEISGKVTAATFSGSGENLTDLPASEVVGELELATLPWASVTNQPIILSSLDSISNDKGNIDLVAGTGISILSDDTLDTITIGNTDKGSSQNIFKNIAVSGQSSLVADANDDILTLITGANLVITTDASGDSITFSVTGTVANADTLDLLDSAQFLRSDVADSFTSGTLTMALGTTLDVLGTFTCTNCVGDTAVADTITASNYLPLAGGTMNGNINLNNNLLLNIGNAGTDFTATGGLNIADSLDVAGHGAFGGAASAPDATKVLYVAELTTSTSLVDLLYSYHLVEPTTSSSANYTNIYALMAPISTNGDFSGIVRGVYSYMKAFEKPDATPSYLISDIRSFDAYLNDYYSVAAASYYGYRVSNPSWNNSYSTLTNFYGFYLAPITAQTGTISTTYGLYLGEISEGTAYPIYQAGSNGYNILAANTRIGSTTNPTVALDVTGSFTLSGLETLSALSISSGSRVANTITFNPAAGGSQYGYNLAITNAPTVTANTAYGIYVSQTDTVDLANTNYGVYSAVSHTGPTAGTIYTYGGYFSATGDGGGTSRAYGVYGLASGANTTWGVIGSGTTGGVNGVGGTYGISGVSVAGTAGVYGVGNNAGVYGAGGTYGVYGDGSTYAVYGTNGIYGVYGTGIYGVYGSGQTYSVYGDMNGAKTSSVYSGYLTNTATSSTAGINKYGLYITSTGTWNGAGSTNYALYIADATGGNTNYAIYQAGTTGTNVLNANTRIGSTSAPTVALDVTGNFQLSGTETLSALNVSSGSRVANTTSFNPAAGGSQYGYNLAITNAPTVTANTAYGIYVSQTDTVDLANTNYGVYSTVTHTGPTSGTIGTYGGYFSATGDNGGSSLAVGVYGTASGADSKYGVYGTVGGMVGALGLSGGSFNFAVYGNGGTVAVYGTNALEGGDFTGSVTGVYASGGSWAVYAAGLIYGTGALSLDGAITAGANGSTHTLTGMLCIKNATACPAQAAGRLYVDTTGTAAGDDPGDVFDIAEYYPAAEGVEKGELVSISPAGGKLVQKSSGAYDPTLIGIVSTNPAAVIEESWISLGADAGNSFNPMKPYVALAGRVPTKVSTENGNIEPGDPLTSSSAPGVAMRATKSGPIVGKALEAYSGSGVGKIMVFVNVGWYVEPVNRDQGSGISSFSSIDTQALTAGTIKTPVLFVGERKISMAKDGSLKIEGNVEITGSLIAEKVSTDELVVSEKSSGSAVVKAGTKGMTIENDLVKETSKVFVTFTTDYSPATRYYVTKEVGESFTLHLDQPVVEDATFDWLIIN